MTTSTIKEIKKLVLVLTTFRSMSKDSEKAILVIAKELEQVTYIQYPIVFQGDITQDNPVLDPILAFFDSGNKVNVIHLPFIERLGLVVQSTIVIAQKINDTTLKIYRMIVAVFSITDQVNKVNFFEETFFVANVNLDMVLGMFFFTLSSIDIDFLKRKL